jgi:DNA-binding transcriptional MerR regulator
MEEPRYTIDELVEKSGLSRRTIRYYVQEGLIPPPAGRGRGGFYNDSHLATLLKIQDLRQRGFTLSAIAGLAPSASPASPALYEPVRQTWARYDVAPGVELHVSRDVEQRASRKLLDLLRAARAIMKEGTDEVNG